MVSNCLRSVFLHRWVLVQLNLLTLLRFLFNWVRSKCLAFWFSALLRAIILDHRIQWKKNLRIRLSRRHIDEMCKSTSDHDYQICISINIYRDWMISPNKTMPPRPHYWVFYLELNVLASTVLVRFCSNLSTTSVEALRRTPIRLKNKSSTANTDNNM